MKPSIEDIRAFVSIVALESFHEASENLFITPSALSRRISKLEEYVGAPLFDRDNTKGQPDPRRSGIAGKFAGPDQ